MGSFYLRKSIRVGPVRFNLSKSGIGTSVGFTGFRIGSGPRGNYVHMGRHGIYYRATLPSSERPRDSGQRSIDSTELPDPRVLHGVDSFQTIDSADVSGMRDSTSEELLQEIASKRRTKRLAPVVLWIGVVTALLLIIASYKLAAGGVAVAFLALFLWARTQDALRKTVVVVYDLDGEIATKVREFIESFESLRRVHRVWHVSASARVRDGKRHGGACALIQRRLITPRMQAPPFLETNVPVPMLPVGQQDLYFLPDRVLILETDRVGAVRYDHLAIRRETQRFIEGDMVPPDARVVDHTWAYVNKGGGPDKRFKNNRQVPIVEYEDLHFTSASGLNELIQLSCVGGASAFQASLASFAARRRSTENESGR